MAKRRKRTSKDIPAKGRLRDIADELWSLAVKHDWNHVCAICGTKGNLNSHHLIPRQHKATRHDLRNGICLCRRCHIFCPDRAPHQNPAGFMQWLESHHPLQGSWYNEMVESGDHKRFDGTANSAYYLGLIQSLREYVEPAEFERIVGVRLLQRLNS